MLLRKQVEDITKLSRGSIDNYTKKGGKYYDPTFPAKRKRGIRGIGWHASEVFAWVASRK